MKRQTSCTSVSNARSKRQTRSRSMMGESCSVIGTKNWLASPSWMPPRAKDLFFRETTAVSMNEAYPGLLEALDALRRQWRQRKLLEGILLTLGGAAAVLLLVVAIDNLLRPGTSWRVLLSITLWGALAAGIVLLIVRRWLDDRRDDFFAAL